MYNRMIGVGNSRQQCCGLKRNLFTELKSKAPIQKLKNFKMSYRKTNSKKKKNKIKMKKIIHG